MAISLALSKVNESVKFIKKCEELLKILPQELSTELKKREADILYVKSLTYPLKGEDEKGIECAEQALALRRELEVNTDIVVSLFQLVDLFLTIGDLNHALEYIKSCENLAMNLNLKHFIAHCDVLFGVIYSWKGELDLALTYNEQVLAFAEKTNDSSLMAGIYNNNGLIYQEKGDFSRALENLEKSMTIKEKYGRNLEILIVSDSLFHLSLEMNDLEKAQCYLNRMKQIADQEENETHFFNELYRIDRAVYLKSSPNAFNRGKAEEILKQMIEEGISSFENLKIALLNLCDLLLFELYDTNELEILDELHVYISQLIEAVKNSRSYSLLVETYLLQARLSLVTLDMIKARQFLTKAQKVADKYGFNRLAIKISHEHDVLLKQQEIWEKLKESKSSLAERMELSRLNEQMKRMISKREIKLPKLNVEQPILLTIMSKEGNVLLSNPFTADMEIDNKQLVEFLSSYNIYCNQIFSETFDRIKLGQYTILINAVNSFTICYLFQGQTYSAQQKMKHFSETLNRNTNLIEKFESAQNEGSTIQVENNPNIEELIIESFMSDPSKFQMPFKAYKGDEPYVFASYAHADKLEVYPIIDYLNKNGIKIWYDEGIPVSENWKKSIAVNLEHCNTFLVFISPHIIDSEYVRKEISFALKKKKLFFAIYLKETKLPTELEFEIADIQAMMKFLMPKNEFFPKLKEILLNSLNK